MFTHTGQHKYGKDQKLEISKVAKTQQQTPPNNTTKAAKGINKGYGMKNLHQADRTWTILPAIPN